MGIEKLPIFLCSDSKAKWTEEELQELAEKLFALEEKDICNQNDS